ncbi:hypothetical protein [Bacillus haynesii]|nr:hypothetical protein [Bacillus haynesii]MEC0633963.1 hypothetical protein [Bacillus haynesii]MEC0701073.1 hypothetical protein [Bacillus haynesii]MEC0707480.1 hypothetical protein [Bacillus haynesii]MEC0719795.1 hypothetical protein [Bacillus haynesii]MEC0737425.1 hypothetical protein [Bacillus haynesii]
MKEEESFYAADKKQYLKSDFYENYKTEVMRLHEPIVLKRIRG